MLEQLQTMLTSLALAAATAFIAWLFNELRKWFGIQESDANELAVRRAAQTEGAKLAATVIDNAVSAAQIAQSTQKIIADLPQQVKAEGYTPIDIADMVTGFLPPGISQLAAIATGVAKGLIK